MTFSIPHFFFFYSVFHFLSPVGHRVYFFLINFRWSVYANHALARYETSLQKGFMKPQRHFHQLQSDMITRGEKQILQGAISRWLVFSRDESCVHRRRGLLWTIYSACPPVRVLPWGVVVVIRLQRVGVSFREHAKRLIIETLSSTSYWNGASLGEVQKGRKLYSTGKWQGLRIKARANILLSKYRHPPKHTLDMLCQSIKAVDL